MKRHGDEGGAYPGMKRQKADGYAEALAAGKFELRLLIASRAAGAVIGKGGENIKRLRQNVIACSFGGLIRGLCLLPRTQDVHPFDDLICYDTTVGIDGADRIGLTVLLCTTNGR